MHPERRKHVRILTIRNFGLALAVLVLVIAAANVISEFRAPPRGEYGRVISRGEPRDGAIKKPMVVEETRVSEGRAGPTPSLLGGARAAPPAQQPALLSVPSAGEAAGAPPSHVVG